MGTINKQTKLPNVYFCYDTVAERYVTGAKGQYTFDSTAGLRRSVAQRLKYNHAGKAYEFLKQHGYERALTDQYEHLVKNLVVRFHTDRKPLDDLEKIMTDLTGYWSGRLDQSVQYGPEAAKWNYTWKKQTRYEVHTIDSAVATVVTK